MARGFLLPALWTLIESLSIPHENSSQPPGDTLIDMIYVFITSATMYRSAKKGSSGHAMMGALTTEVSPYWHLMNSVIHEAQPVQSTAITQMGNLAEAWMRLGEALQLNLKRAPRRIEGTTPTAPSFCSWPLCGYHSRKPPNALKICKGCAEAQYCGKRCQFRRVYIPPHWTMDIDSHI